MLKSIGGQYRHLPLAVMMVWVEMLPEDAQADIEALAATMDDTRVQSFHDPHCRAGTAIARTLGAEGEKAWDVYLFFGSNAKWADHLPAPKGWAHQLTDAWAEPSRRRRHGQLDSELARFLASVATR